MSKLALSISELVQLLNAQPIAPLNPDQSAYQIESVAPLDNAESHSVSFLSNPRYIEQASQCRAAAIVTDKKLAAALNEQTNAYPGILLLADTPYLALATVLKHFHPTPAPETYQHPSAVIAKSARIEEKVYIGPGVVIEEHAVIGAGARIDALCFVGEGVSIGEHTRLHAGVKVLERCSIGQRCILHAGVIVGSDGYGFATSPEGKHIKVAQTGDVSIEDDVEIGANSCIDRATFGTTRIGAGTKIDNLVQIAHNVIIQPDCLIVSQSGIAGSSTLGAHSVMGAQSGIAGHIRLEAQTILAARSGVTRPLKGGATYAGFPARPYRDWLTSIATLARLPKLRRLWRDKTTKGRDA